MPIPLRLVFAVLSLGLAAGCASTRAVPRPFPAPHATGTPPPAPPALEPPGARPGAAAATTALGLRGTPYLLGGTDPSGFDCSGLVRYVFAQEGAGLPRTVSGQRQAGVLVGREDVQAGDLLFFATAGVEVSHVAIAIGDGQFVHAPSGQGAVRVERLDAPYWASRFVEARRVF